jgi:hypothetical protein
MFVLYDNQNNIKGFAMAYSGNLNKLKVEDDFDTSSVDEYIIENNVLIKKNNISIVTMRQARLALFQAGKLNEVETAIQNSNDEELKIEWNYATEVPRNWESLIRVANNLGITDAEIDDLFELAKTL